MNTETAAAAEHEQKRGGDAGPKKGGKKWAARLGVAGFAFFLVKGLVWLAIPAFAAIKMLLVD